MAQVHIETVHEFGHTLDLARWYDAGACTVTLSDVSPRNKKHNWSKLCIVVSWLYDLVKWQVGHH